MVQFFMLNLIKKYKPKKLMEIGLACGTSAAFMLLAMDKKSKLMKNIYKSIFLEVIYT